MGLSWNSTHRNEALNIARIPIGDYPSAIYRLQGSCKNEQQQENSDGDGAPTLRCAGACVRLGGHRGNRDQAGAALQRGAVVQRPARARLYAVAQTASPLEPSARSPVVAWGVCGFLGIMGSAIGRLTKVAIVPVLQRDLTLLQWSLFGSTMAAFAYFEGYKAFQLKFSPMLVQRAMTLSREGTPLHHIALAPFYSMGLFHATKKRRIIAWGSAARSTRKPGRHWDSAPCPPPPRPGGPGGC